MSQEIVLTGIKAINLLNCPDFPKENIFQAHYYNGNDKGDTELITSFEDGYIVTSQSRYSVESLKSDDNELIFPTVSLDLKTLINQSIPEAMRIQENLTESLKSIGVPAELLKQSPKIQKSILRSLRQETLPSKFQRGQVFQFIEKTQSSLGWWIPYFEKWLKLAEHRGQYEAEGRLHLTYLFRHTGQLKKAIQVSNVVEFENRFFPCSPGLLAAIATVRAATFLDIFELHFDPNLLKSARLTANKAYAKTQASHTSAVYRRLSNFEREIDRINYQQKINEAYRDWADWSG